MKCFKNGKAHLDKYIREINFQKLKKTLYAGEVISTLISLIMGIIGVTNWIKFWKTDYVNNGYYFFQKGINQTNVNLNFCSVFNVNSLDQFQSLFIKNKSLITFQFWYSLIILLTFQIIDLRKGLIILRRNEYYSYFYSENNESYSKKLLVRDLNIFKSSFKFAFIPGVYIIDNINF